MKISLWRCAQNVRSLAQPSCHFVHVALVLSLWCGVNFEIARAALSALWVCWIALVVVRSSSCAENLDKEVFYRELGHKSYQESSFTDLAQRPCIEICQEVSYVDLAKRALIESLYRDLAKRPLLEILYTDLVKRTDILLRDFLHKVWTEILLSDVLQRSCAEISYRHLVRIALQRDLLQLLEILPRGSCTRSTLICAQGTCRI